jgi:hypothetical protein
MNVERRTAIIDKRADAVFYRLSAFVMMVVMMVVEMYEKQGGRHQSFEVENEDLVRAETVNELKVR